MATLTIVEFSASLKPKQVLDQDRERSRQSASSSPILRQTEGAYHDAALAIDDKLAENASEF